MLNPMNNKAYTLVLNDGLGEKYFTLTNVTILHWDETTYNYFDIVTNAAFVSGCTYNAPYYSMIEDPFSQIFPEGTDCLNDQCWYIEDKADSVFRTDWGDNTSWDMELAWYLRESSTVT